MPYTYTWTPSATRPDPESRVRVATWDGKSVPNATYIISARQIHITVEEKGRYSLFIRTGSQSEHTVVNIPQNENIQSISDRIQDIESRSSEIRVNGEKVDVFDVDTAPGIVGPAVIVPQTSVISAPASATWPTANMALFTRISVPVTRTYNKLGLRIATGTGNIQYGVVKLSGTNGNSYTRVMNSGVIPCPSDKYTLDLPTTELVAGDYALFFWADNNALGLRWVSDYNLGALQLARQVIPGAGGVPASGTFSGEWVSGMYISGLSLGMYV